MENVFFTDFVGVGIFFLAIAASVVATVISIHDHKEAKVAKEENKDLRARLEADRLEVVKLRTSLSKLGRVRKIVQPIPPKAKSKKTMWLGFQDTEAIDYIVTDKDEMTLYIVTPPTQEEKKEYNKPKRYAIKERK